MAQGTPWKAGLCALSVALIAAFPGCRREEVAHARIPKERAMPAAGPGAGPMAREPAPGDDAPPPGPSGGAALKWSLPEGWGEAGGGGMRYATLRPPVEGRIDVSVVVLPGAAGGELANVNRWRGQIGLPALDDAALAASRKVVATRAGKVSLYDFESEGRAKTRMVAGLLETADGNTWFLKMVGDAAPVAASRAPFVHFLESLHFD